MKKSLLKTAVFLVLLSAGLTLQAQHYYVSLTTGYGFTFNALTYYNEVRQIDQSADYHTVNDVKGMSFGKGYSVCGAVGYMFTKNFGVELGLSYLIGATTTVTDSTFSTNDFYGNYNFLNTDYSARMFRINPSIIFTAGFKKINPYARFGLLLGFGRISVTSDEVYRGPAYDPNQGTIFVTNRINQTEKISGSMALGLNAAIGASYSLSEKIDVTAELQLISLSYAPTKGEVVEYNVNGVDYMSNLPDRYKVIEYSENYTYNSVAGANNETTQRTRVNQPFSSLGFNIGLKLKL